MDIVRPGMRPYRLKAKQADPTPEEITAECALIRASWSESERLSRLRCDQRPTFTRCDGQRVEMAANDYRDHHTRDWLDDEPD